MAVLIVESVRELGRVWQSALERLGADVELATINRMPFPN